jgi:hypothetical protein
MSIRSQAELEVQYQQRTAQVQAGTLSPQQAFGIMDEWVLHLGKRKAMLHPGLRQWMWYDHLHDEWASAGCGVGEAILLSIGNVGGIKKLPQQGDASGWCVYQQGQKLYGPLRTGELLDKLKSQPELKDILVWSTLATTWLSVFYETEGAISLRDEAGNQVSVSLKVEAVSDPAPAAVPSPTDVTLVGSRKAPVPSPTDVTLVGSRKALVPSPTEATPVGSQKALVPSPTDVTLVGSRKVHVDIFALSIQLEDQRFPMRAQLRLGRDADNDLTLPDEKVSLHHALIQRQGVVYKITDLDSASGTFVNGNRITGPTLLRNGDIVLIGDTKLTISDQA